MYVLAYVAGLRCVVIDRGTERKSNERRVTLRPAQPVVK